MSSEPYAVQRFRGGFALVWWEDRNGRRTRRRKQLQATDRQSAEAEARAEWTESDRSPWTVGRLVNAYVQTLAGRPAYQRRQDAWKAMRGFWEHVDPARIDEAMCRSYRALRRVSDATARLELMTISNALNWGLATSKLGSRRPIWLPPQPERKIRHLTRAQFERFFVGVHAEHARLYVMLGLYTLARPSAILDLTWDRVDFMRRRIDLNADGRAQTSKRRPVVAIGGTLLGWLQRAYEARTSIYVVERGGKKVGSIKKAFQAASERSAVHATPYTLRHTGAVWAAEGGTPMPQLAQMMGHNDDRTTQHHYARFSPDFLAGVVDAIEGKVKSA